MSHDHNQAWSDNPELWMQLGFDTYGLNRGAKSSPVEAAVSLICGDISTLPFLLKQERPDGTSEVIRNSPVARVLAKPNEFSTRVDFINSMLRDTYYYGNAYAWIERDTRGQPMALYHIRPRQITPKILTDGSVYYSVGLSELEAGEQSGMIDVPAADIIHHRIITMRHPLLGVSPLYALGSSASLNAYLSSSLARFHENSSRPGGILSVPGGLRPEARERLRHEFSRAFTGENAGKTAVLDFETKYEKLGSTAQENDAVNLLKYSVEDVARCLRVPRFMLGLETVGQASVEQSTRVYYSHALRPAIEALEARFDDAFGLVGTERYVEFQINDLFRAETAARIDALGKGVQNGVYTPNEARRLEGLPPIEGGDQAFLQRQMTPVNMLSELAAQEAAPDPEPQEVDPDNDVEDQQLSAASLTDAIMRAVKSETRGEYAH